MKQAAIAILMLLSAALPAAAQQTANDRAKVADAYGQVQKRVSRTPERWMALAVGDLLPPDSAVRTAASSAILLQTPDRHAIRVGSSTTLELKEVGGNNSFSFQLVAGEIWSFVNKARKPARFEVDTPTAVLGVRGTIFNVAHDATTNESSVSVNEGTVSLNQGGAMQSVEEGYEMNVRPNQLRQARAVRHSPATQQMWRVLLRENWANTRASAKLNRQAEIQFQRLRNQERAETARRNRQAAQAAARQKAKEEKEKARAEKAGKGRRREQK